jgi:hypothetical protein
VLHNIIKVTLIKVSVPWALTSYLPNSSTEQGKLQHENIKVITYKAFQSAGIDIILLL